MKPGGWKKFEQATDDIAEKMSTIIENESDIDEVISRIEKLQNKAKFTAFGKTKIKNRKSTVLNRDQALKHRTFSKDNLNNWKRKYLRSKVTDKEGPPRSLK